MSKIKIIYDIKSLPDFNDLTPEDILVKLPEEINTLLYDSSKGGHIPQVVDLESDIQIVDSTTEEGKRILKQAASKL